MARTTWKHFERLVATKLGGRRFPASTGGLVDVEAPGILCQVKERQRITLRELERWAGEIDAEARKRPWKMDLEDKVEKPVIGIVVVKRSAGAGRKTEALVVMTLEAWCR